MSVALLAVLTMVAAAQQPAAQQPATQQPAMLQPAAQPGVLLLRNGQVISGRIARAGDVYCVALPYGEIRVKAITVELCCRDLEDGYWQKRARLRAGNVDDHLGLAQWCLRQGLLGHAGQELATVMAIDPTHPSLRLLERRLDSANSLSQPTPITKHTAEESPDPAPSLDELDRMVRAMPTGTVETFKQTIQPLLLNNCTSIGCHGPTSTTPLRLMRSSISAAPSRRLTQRNLHATLQWIDPEHPMASRLLTTPIAPHGTAKTAIFVDRQSVQYEGLVEWVRQVASGRQPAEDTAVVSAGHTAPPGDESGSEVVFYQDDPANLPKPSIQRGAPMPGYVPVDPFDAEVFNRRFFPE
ncbi:MAG TPA: hypothetical protein VE890_07190 [Thermoguttaceae bacterium]|nr:hypothetical protein [Thermoguttaceae bacterium]